MVVCIKLIKNGLEVQIQEAKILPFKNRRYNIIFNIDSLVED
jgi:hypothetical protein